MSKRTMTDEMAMIALMLYEIPLLKDIIDGRISKSKKVSNTMREQLLSYYGTIALLLNEIDNGMLSSIVEPAVVRFELESAFHIDWVNQIADYGMKYDKPLPDSNRTCLFCRPFKTNATYGYEFDTKTRGSIIDYAIEHENDYFDIAKIDLFSDLKAIPFEYRYPLPGMNRPLLFRNQLIAFIFDASDSEWKELQGKYLFAHDLVVRFSRDSLSRLYLGRTNTSLSEDELAIFIDNSSFELFPAWYYKNASDIIDSLSDDKIRYIRQLYEGIMN